MKDLGEASHILGIKLLRDRQKRMLGLSQASYIDEILARFSMQDSKKEFVPLKVGSSLSANQRPKTPAEIERMRGIPYVRLWEVSCMRCCVQGLTSALPLAWLADFSQTLAKNTG